MKYNHYDVSYKMAVIKEYYELEASRGISIREFARSKNLCHATFYQWLKIYEKESCKQNDPSDDQGICLSPCEDHLSSAFISLSADQEPDDTVRTLVSYKENRSLRNMKLLYKDIAIEFDKEDLPFILRSIRE